MKCPYNNFKECIMQECPACNYEIEYEDKRIVTGWKCHDLETGEEYIEPNLEGVLQRTPCGDPIIKVAQEKHYKFISCKYADEKKRPVAHDEIKVTENVTHKTTNQTNVIKHGLFG